MLTSDPAQKGRKDIDFYIKQLVDSCSCWDEYRDYYLNTFIPGLQFGTEDATETEKAIIENIRSVASRDQWNNLPRLVDSFVKWRDAETELREQERQDAAKQKACLLRQQALKRQRTRVQEKEVEGRLKSTLGTSLLNADRLNDEINGQAIFDYQQLRTEYLTKWLNKRLHPKPISDEQITAIGEMSQSFLLRARAGSGKTSVITAKSVFLMEHERIAADELMILAFNRKAAKEVKKSVRRDRGVMEFDNARTFHSLAYQLVRPRAELLFDERTGSTQRQSVFLQKLINTVMNPALLAQIYFFFRQEIKELEDIGAFMSKTDYYTYRRNHVQETLRGENVKSAGEKWIADFLFEHGIPYAYERIWYWDDPLEGNYQPDFSLSTSGKAPDIVIEHWGIDLSDPTQSVPAHWDQTWQEYRDQIERKRAYWKRYNQKNPDQPVVLLETSVADLRSGREAFEKTLFSLLSQVGVTLQRLSERELQEGVVVRRIARFSGMCLQYIQKAKKQRLNPDDLSEKISAASDLDAKTKAFLRIANNLYLRYQKALAKSNKIDFDDLMAAAIKLVHETEGKCQIRITDDRLVAMTDLQWIMIDEYQDFSRLFFDLIDAIRIYNNTARLFCVGDDWQAINAFAGSDLRFFNGFSSHARDGNVGDLQNNYRSAREIVSLGNSFMAGTGKGKASIATRVDLKGHIEACPTDKIWIEQRRGDQYSDDRAVDERFFTWVVINGEKRQTDAGLRIGRMLKKCHSILVDTKYDGETEFAILSRVDRLGRGYPNMQAFQRKLRETLRPDERKTFGDFDARVRCGTVHSFKGLEADVVIVLGVNERNFPKIHPDNELFSIFGVTPAEVLAEEERLFYVAITRAKRDLYLLTETGRESEFLGRLGIAATQVNRSRPPKRGSTVTSDDDIPF